MIDDKTGAPSPGIRGEPLRLSVLDAAERLLRKGKRNFSMRELAAEAGVSFATPFNQFGNKTAIMHALSARRIERMTQRFIEAPAMPDAVDRVLQASRIAAEVMIAESGVNRVVMEWLGSASASPGQILAHSAAFWSLALGEGEGLTADDRETALRVLPHQLAFGFRGVLSFWTAGELSDDDLVSSACATAGSLLRGFVGTGARIAP